MTRLLPLLAVALLATAPRAQVTHGGPLPLADATFETADGSQTSLTAAAGDAGLVVLFWSNACPWADRYAARVADLVSGYTPAGVGFVLVNATSTRSAERASSAASREHAAGAGLAVPYLMDPAGRLATAFGADDAPSAFFFGPQGTLRYTGAIDDSPADVSRVQVPYLRQALDQSIAGLPIEVQQTEAFGCTIQTGAR